MDSETFRSMVEEEAVLLDRFGMTMQAAKLRACTSMTEAIAVHQDTEALLRVAKMAK